MAAILGRFLYFSSIALSAGSKSFSDKGMYLKRKDLRASKFVHLAQ